MVAMTLIRIGVEINSCTKNRSTKTTIWLHRAEAPSRRGQSSGRRLKEIRGWGRCAGKRRGTVSHSWTRVRVYCKRTISNGRLHNSESTITDYSHFFLCLYPWAMSL
jgi:hypothetical protein